MFDRLYVPDFGAIFGEKFANPYEYPMIDSLVWPTLIDIKLPAEGEQLLKLTRPNDTSHPLFYRRKISINQLVTELKASQLEGACVQAIELGRDYGIPSKVVLGLAKKYPNFLFPIVAPKITPSGIQELNTQASDAAAVVIYPSYTQLDLGESNAEVDKLCKICAEKNVPLKLDLGYMHFPENDQTCCTVPKVRKFANAHPETKILLSGIDILGCGFQFLNLLRWEPNSYVELDPRTFGGITPENFFNKIFEVPGMVQNAWSRIILGSSTPMLESSQVTRGWLAATEKLPFAQRCLLRTWMYRNIHRIYNLKILPRRNLQEVSPAKFAELLAPRVIQGENGNLMIQQDLALHSFAITQLLYISPYVLDAAQAVAKKYPDYGFGEFTLKSYHTTTSLVVNEHEFGNYLQLHYQFAEASMADAQAALHTVAAEENRADFNYPDHILASTHGDKDYTVPIVDGKIQLGGRENIYVLVTFGPRAIKLSLNFKLFKGKDSTAK